jgi:hypothetical protein
MISSYGKGTTDGLDNEVEEDMRESDTPAAVVQTITAGVSVLSMGFLNFGVTTGSRLKTSTSVDWAL